MAAKINYQVRDYSDEYSTVGFEINPIGAANYPDVELLTPGGAANEIYNAILGVISGNVAAYNAKTEDDVVNDVQPTEPSAQRESGLRVYGRDNNGKLHSRTIPCPNFAVLATPGTDLVNLAGTEMAALVAALEAHWTPGGALSVTIEKAMLVGRAS